MHLLRVAESMIPTNHGDLRVVVYREPAIAESTTDPHREHVAIVAGDPVGEEVLARVHSECWTSEVLGSRKCDCAEQLDHALARIAAAGRGVVIYLRQEGRGIGLGNKIRAYALQEGGQDTVQANEALGFPADLRAYGAAAEMLRDLGVQSVALMTNNPAKIAGLEAAGVRVARRESHWVAASEHAGDYIDAKIEKMGHLEASTDEKIPGGDALPKKLARAR
jgi:GTP cyclohydrolase II